MEYVLVGWALFSVGFVVGYALKGRRGYSDRCEAWWDGYTYHERLGAWMEAVDETTPNSTPRVNE